MGLAWAIASAVFLADLCIKSYLFQNFGHVSIPVIKNIFHITLVANKGAAFGILQGKTDLLILIGILFVIIFCFMAKNDVKKSLLFAVAFGLILGGAVSNLLDRIFLGFVIDYLDFRIWPVFNLSDTCISTGVGLIVFGSFRKPKAPKPKING